jgi:hypothetical protein
MVSTEVSSFAAHNTMDTSNYNFPVAAEVLRLQKAAAHKMYLKKVSPKKRGANGLPVNEQGARSGYLQTLQACRYASVSLLIVVGEDTEVTN